MEERTGEVEIRRSARRRRTIQAYRDGDRTVVLVPAHLSPEEEREQVARLVARLDARAARSPGSDDDLLARARGLSATYLDGRAEPSSVRWVDNQTSRWGSCTPTTRTIRLSDRLRGMPDYVVDHVLLHELAHLVEPNHSARFHALVAGYPHAVKAEGFLEGVTWPRR